VFLNALFLPLYIPFLFIKSKKLNDFVLTLIFVIFICMHLIPTVVEDIVYLLPLSYLKCTINKLLRINKLTFKESKKQKI
jgi:hypothetical protein